MDSVIFLNKVQYKILLEAGIPLLGLTTEKLKDVLAVNDYYDIIATTKAMLKPENLLFKLGFKDSDTDANYVTEESILNNVSNNIIVDAFVSDRNSIILWESTSDTNDANDMVRRSLFNIVKAMLVMIPLATVKLTPQFKLCIKTTLCRN